MWRWELDSLLLVGPFCHVVKYNQNLHDVRQLGQHPQNLNIRDLLGG